MTIQSFDAGRSELPLHPIEPSWIEEGTPVARAITLTESPDTHLSSGLWGCTAGKFKWTYGLDELVYILEGEVTVSEVGGRTFTLRAGDVAYFPLGLVAHWHVPQYVKKFFVLRTPAREGLVARVRRRVARWRAR